MSTCSPHKNISLKKLIEIRENGYYLHNKDFEQSEIDEMINLRLSQKLEMDLRNYVILDKQHQKESDNLRGLKSCSKCKWKLPFKYYSPDKSKKSGLRSHCKFCRNIGLYDYLTVLQ